MIVFIVSYGSTNDTLPQTITVPFIYQRVTFFFKEDEENYTKV